MTDLRATLDRLALSQAGFARLTDNNAVSVRRWCCGDRPIPGWLPSWLAMYEALTAAQRKKLFP